MSACRKAGIGRRPGGMGSGAKAETLNHKGFAHRAIGAPRAPSMRGAVMVRTSSFLTLVALAAVARPAVAIELQPATADAWQEYVRNAGVRMQARVSGNESFLWMDQAENRTLRVRQGEIMVAPMVGKGIQNVPGGIIHHWIGAAFIPGATMETLLTVVHDYDRYSQFYKPVVKDSKSLASNATEREFSMVWAQHVLFINAAMQGWYRAQDFQVDSRRGYSIVSATRIQQIDHYRHSSEHLMSPDTGDGFMWRIHTIARYEQRDGGVYLEIEAMALTRDVPASLRWMVMPAVNHLSISSLTTTLSQTRQAIGAHRATVVLAMQGRKGEN